MSDATRKGVSDEAELQQADAPVETQETEVSSDEQLKGEIYGRNKTIEDIATRFHEQRLRELGQLPEEEGDAGEAAEAQVADETESSESVPSAPVSAPAAAQPAPDVPVYLKNGEYFTKLKVNGQEQEVPFSRVQATMQKHTAADQRLQYASELLRRAEERERALRENEQRLRERTSPPSQDVGESDEELKKAANTVINKLLDGEAEQAADDLVKMLKGRRQTAPTPDFSEIEKRATQSALKQIEQQEYQKDLNRGNQIFSEKYPEIMSDPDLFTLADQKTLEISREKPYLTPSQVLLEAGEVIMQKFVRRAAPAPADDRSRSERKSNLKPMPKPATARQARPAAPPPPMSTPSSYLDSIRKARGQGR